MYKFFEFRYIYLIPILLSAIFSLRSFGLKWPKAYRLFSLFLILTLITELFAIYWKWYWHETKWWSFNKYNNWIYNSFHLARFALFVSFYYRMLDSLKVKKAIIYISPAIIAFGILDYFFIESPHYLNVYTIILTDLLSLFLSLFFLAEILRRRPVEKLYINPMVWISIAAFLYSVASIPYFMSSLYIPKHREAWEWAREVLTRINESLNIIVYSFYLIAFLCPPPSKK